MVIIYRKDISLFLKCMRISTFIIAIQLSCFSLLAATAPVHAQVSIEVQQADIRSVFTAIEKQAAVTFTFNENTLKAVPAVSLKIRNRPLEEVLSAIEKQTGLQFRQAGKLIAVSKSNAPNTPVEARQLKKADAPDPPVKVSGKVVDGNGLPLPGATITVRGTTLSASADAEGRFQLSLPGPATLLISYVGYKSTEISVGADDMNINIVLEEDKMALQEVAVVSTGYQTLPKERATGSFVQLDNDILNRRVSTSIIDRLEGITPGLVFNRNIKNNENEAAFSIRGRSTINGNPAPLIVIDNFPYEGDISNINPNDVESITVLKDAAAASIWGARSGNGVVVITTKKGKYGQAPEVSFNANVTAGNKPDLSYIPMISSGDMIELTRILFDKGLYNSTIANGYTALYPAVEVLQAQKSGVLTAAAANAQLEQMKQYDLRNDVEKYYYQKSINQQYHINISGGSDRQRYFLSGGYDDNRSNLVRNGYKRVTINGTNTYRLLKDKLELTTAITFTSGSSDQNNTGKPSMVWYPYARLADDNGQPLPIQPQFRKSYTDTVGKGRLLDFTYRPLDELKMADNRTKTADYRINTMLKYRIVQGLDAQFSYQYNKGTSQQRNLMGADTYDTRSLINRYTQVNSTTGAITKPVPDGAILDYTDGGYASHKSRVQFNYAGNWSARHEVNAMGGVELMDYQAEKITGRYYGYNPENATFIPVDNVNNYPTLPTGSPLGLVNVAEQLFTTDRYISYFANASYTYLRRYTLSGSARKDESNLFGVRSNQKGVPLWSAGMAWRIDQEPFYRLGWLPSLRLRLTGGVNGNVDKSVSAYTTALANGTNRYGAPQEYIVNPPNPELRWEKVNVWNAGIDFALQHNILSGSIEYYLKNARDLIGTSAIAPNTGVATFRGNNADLRTWGVDLVLNSRNLSGKFGWTSNFLLSYVTDKITNYKSTPSTVSSYINIFSNPIEGYPYSAVFAYKWAGLDGQGNPQGYVNDAISTDYGRLTRPLSVDEMTYAGSSRPRYFGGLRNNFSYKGITLSANVTFKLKYVQRMNALQYSKLLVTNSQSAFGYADYALRWQKPGDEQYTNVPSFQYPNNTTREQFYTNSEVHIEKGDHIRLQDIQLSYDIRIGKRKPAFRSARLYVYANNLGVLWKATKLKFDPDYTPDVNSWNIVPQPFSLSLGCNIGF